MQSMKSAASRSRILERGVDLISIKGVTGMTFGLLAEAVGMSKSGLFAHFKSKEDVQIQLIDHAARLSAEHIVRPAEGFPEGLERLRALFGNWLGWSVKAGLGGGCPMAAAFFEFDDLPGEVRDHLRVLEARSQAVFAEQVLAAIRDGALRPDLDVDQFVWELGGVYLAHHVSSRLAKQPDATKRAMGAFEGLISRASPGL